MKDESSTRSDEGLIEAVRKGCQAADVHLTCSFPKCTCKQIPAAIHAVLSEQQPSDTDRLKWLLDDYRRIDLHNAIGTMSYDLDVCRKAIDKTMQSERPDSQGGKT